MLIRIAVVNVIGMLINTPDCVGTRPVTYAAIESPGRAFLTAFPSGGGGAAGLRLKSSSSPTCISRLDKPADDRRMTVRQVVGSHSRIPGQHRTCDRGTAAMMPNGSVS